MKNKYRQTNKANFKYIIPFIIMFILSIILFIISQANINKYYVKVGEIELTKAQYNYFYEYTINEFKTKYANQLEYFELDFNKDLSLQEMEDGYTWEDYFVTLTDKNIYEILSINNDAIKNGYNNNTSESINILMSSIKENENTNNVSFEHYIKTLYDKNITEDMLEECLSYIVTYYDYLDTVNFDFSEEEYEDYYNKNKDELDYVEYYVAQIDEKIENKEELLLDIHSEEDYFNISSSNNFYPVYEKVTGYSNANPVFANFIFNSKNNTADFIYDENNDKTYFVYKIDRKKDITNTKNILVIMSEVKDNEKTNEKAYERIENIQKKFSLTQKKEKDFRNLMSAHEELNSYALTNIKNTDIPQIMSSWVFNESTELNEDMIIVDEQYVYYLYIYGNGLEVYKAIAKDNLTTKSINEYITNCKNSYTYIKR